jgi:tRNA pseudouridine55 synthase
MDGILLINKPIGLTSHQIVNIIRQKLNIRKVGHAGTLDPLATGLLVIMVGKATKLSNQLISQSKSYEVEMKLFVKTDTGDVMGKITKEENFLNIRKNRIQEVISFFHNYTYYQKPPLYSAVKIKDRKLYEYARQEVEVEVPFRLITIKKIKLLDYQPSKGTIKLFVECSKGTYVRSLVQDMAEKLGTVATVSQLRRISSGSFQISQAIPLAEVSKEKIIA